MSVRRQFGIVAVLALLLSGCAVSGGAAQPYELTHVFSLVKPDDRGAAWQGVATQLLERTESQLDSGLPDTASSGRSTGTRPGASVRAAGVGVLPSVRLAADTDTTTDTSDDTAGERERSVSGIGRIREFHDAAIDIEGSALSSRLVMGFEKLDATPPAPGFTHNSRETIPVCLADGETHVSGEWTVRHDQVIDQPDGGLVVLEITIKATLKAASRDGDVFDATGIHMHIRRTDTLPNGGTTMMQGSVTASITGISGGEWPSRIVQALEKRDVEVFTKDAWVRDEGFAYLGVAGMSAEVPHAVAQAQREAEKGAGCGWAIVPLEMSNTVLNPLGDIPETRRWSGYVCGDPFTTAWHFTEERMGFRGNETIEHEIVPVEDARSERGFGVMPRIERTDALDGPGFRLSFEEKWPEGIRAVSHQRAYAEVVPAAQECQTS